MLTLGRHLKFSGLTSRMKKAFCTPQSDRMTSNSIYTFGVEVGPKSVEFRNENAKLTVGLIDKKSMREYFGDRLNGHFTFTFTPTSEKKQVIEPFDNSLSQTMKVSSKNALLFMNLGEENTILGNTDEFSIKKTRENYKEYGIIMKKLKNDLYKIIHYTSEDKIIKSSISIDLKLVDMFILKSMLRSYLPHTFGWYDDVDFLKEDAPSQQLPSPDNELEPTLADKVHVRKKKISGTAYVEGNIEFELEDDELSL